MNKGPALIIFQKNLVLGKVKTRLAQTIGDDLALEVYEKLVELTQKEAEQVQLERLIYFSDFLPEETPKPGFSYCLQMGADLGERMSNAFAEVFEKGFSPILIIGTDCPLISCEVIEDALDQLGQVDLVIGPAEDGGYFLLGMRTFFPEIFKTITWSSDQVLPQTLEIARKQKLNIGLLPVLFDIDHEEDLNRFINLKPEYEYLFRNSSGRL